MRYYKVLNEDGTLLYIGSGDGVGIDITEEEYAELKNNIDVKNAEIKEWVEKVQNGSDISEVPNDITDIVEMLSNNLYTLDGASKIIASEVNA